MTTRRQLIVGLPGVAGLAVAAATHAAAQPAVAFEQAPDLPADVTTFEDVHPGLGIDLSTVALEEAALAIQQRYGRRGWRYTLNVPRHEEPFAIQLLKDIGAQTRDNPFAPYVNLRVHDRADLGQYWWYLTAWDEGVESGLVVNVGSMGA